MNPTDDPMDDLGDALAAPSPQPDEEVTETNPVLANLAVNSVLFNPGGKEVRPGTEVTILVPMDAEVLSIEPQGKLTYISKDPPGKPAEMRFIFASGAGAPANQLKNVPYGVVSWHGKVENTNIWAFLVHSESIFA